MEMVMQKNKNRENWKILPQIRRDSGHIYHFRRRRIDNLLAQAVKHKLVLVCAGAGYGKTSAVHDFVRDYPAATVWLQLSDRDNVGARLWENYTNAMNQISRPFASAIGKLGFPDTVDKLRQYQADVRKFTEQAPLVIVLDDFHLIKDASVIRFVERSINDLPHGTVVFIISRSTPQINVAGLVAKDQITNIGENDLRFNEYELAEYFRRLETDVHPGILREIIQDTRGWAFAIGFIMRSYRKAPGYGGYLRSAMKTNIFRLMEMEIWGEISGRLKDFLVRLSLIGHLSFDLITLLAGDDESLLAELEEQSAYVRRDNFINAFLIHPLFLEFLESKQGILSEGQKREIYTVAGNWCNNNGFKIDALSYFGKIGDYESIVSILFTFPVQIPEDIAKFAAGILERAGDEAFEKVEFLAVMHLRSCMCQGLWQKSLELAEYYEAKLLRLPEENAIKRTTLSRLYFSWSHLRDLMCTMDDRYDFDLYVDKFCKSLPKPADPGNFPVYSPGPWINRAGSSRKGAPEEYIEAKTRMQNLLSECHYGFNDGEDELARGELEFYRDNLRAAERCISGALIQARKNRQFGIAHLALFYTLRLCVAQGNYEKAEQALKDMKALLDESENADSSASYDLALAWYCCALGLPEKTPDWLKGNFSQYGHASFFENFGNQMKALYCYSTRNFVPVLAYIDEMKQRESTLYGRIGMLAMEACVYYRMKEKDRALAVLKEAYETASPNDLVMPFIELGKDMRTLTGYAMRESAAGIPQAWLEGINRKAAYYAKHQVHVAEKYRQANRLADDIVLSPRESDILLDLSHGLSRTEIAESRGLSVNTVKMVINNTYCKLGAGNLAGLIRIAVEQKRI